MIETVHLFPLLDQKLIDLLKSLSSEEWNKPTVARLWTVKDVAAHLLDGNLKVISGLRDGHHLPPDQVIDSYEDLVGSSAADQRSHGKTGNHFGGTFLSIYRDIAPRPAPYLQKHCGAYSYHRHN